MKKLILRFTLVALSFGLVYVFAQNSPSVFTYIKAKKMTMSDYENTPRQSIKNTSNKKNTLNGNVFQKNEVVKKEANILAVPSKKTLQVAKTSQEMNEHLRSLGSSYRAFETKINGQKVIELLDRGTKAHEIIVKTN